MSNILLWLVMSAIGCDAYAMLSPRAIQKKKKEAMSAIDVKDFRGQHT